MKELKRTLAMLLALVLLCGILPVSANAAATNVSGTIYTSNLADNAELKLTGSTTLVVDANKTLKSISGDYALTIQGSNTTLTINNSGGHGISVSSFTTNLSACSIVIDSKKDGLNIDKDIVLKGGMVSVDAGKDGIYSRNGSITINGGIVDSSCGTNCAAIKAMVGDIVINAGTIETHGAKEGITAEAGSVQLNGNVTARAAGWAIWAKQDVKVNGGTTNARAGCAIYAGGAFAMKADVTAESTIDGAPAISAKGSITVNGGTLTAKCSTNGAALKAYNGSILVNAGDVIASGAKEGLTAEEGSIRIYGNVTARASGWAIWAKNGILIQDGRTTARAGCAIYSGSYITIDADVEAEAFMNGAPAISAKNNITINGGTIKADCSTNGAAIISYNGNIAINAGDVTASGAKEGITAEKGSVKLAGNVTASASGWAVWGETGITVPAPYRILVPANGQVSGKQIVNQNGNRTTNVQIGIPPLTGTISTSGITPAPGAQLSYSLSGMAAGLSESELSFQWQESSNGSNGWTDKAGATAKFYVVQTADVGKYIRVKITADGYDGMLYSSPWLCCKWPCETGVVSPILEVSGNQVRVTNPQSNQEYILLNYKKSISDLTESDWANSKTWSSGVLFLGGTANTTNYVYTRVKEDSGHYAGKTVGWQSIYLGTTTYLQSFKLQYQLVSYANGAWVPQDMELDEMGFYYYMKMGDIIKITVDPVPANAAFNGVRGDNWLINSSSAESELGHFYQEPGCLHTLEADKYYKTVYFRCEKQANHVLLSAQYYKGYNDLIYESFSIHVANSSGEYLLESASARVPVNVGSSVTDYPVNCNPDRATLTGVTAVFTGGTGTTPPEITLGETTVSVNAEKAAGGEYYYDFYKNGNKLIGGITVVVTAPPAEDLKIIPSELTGEAGNSYELALQFFPANAETPATWTSSNPAAATVDHGVVTIPESADIGATATITATAGGKSATCLITVAGEKFDLEIDGVQVTTRNMEDILGNGVFTFDGNRILTVSDSYSTGRRLIYNRGIDGLVINAINDVTLTSTGYETIITGKNTTIIGEGSLTLKAPTECGIYMTSDATLTIRDTEVFADAKWGIVGPNGANNAKLVINHASVTARATDGAVCDFGGGITLENCEIVKPQGGKLSNDGKDIVDSADAISNDVQINPVEPAQLLNPFTDVKEDKYYYEPVLWAYYHDPQITAGTSDTTFSPNDTCTRAQIVTFLWRAAGSPEPATTNNPFKDVASGKYYYKAVLWAAETGVTSGTSDTTFSPNDGCTRAQVVTFLWRFAGSPEPTTTTNPFTDVPAGKYYTKAVLWAAEKGVTAGTSATTFSPNDTCTRGQIVTFLYRYMEG